LFDAWRYERADHIVVPLLHRISEKASAAGATNLAQTLKRALGALISSLKFNLGTVSIDPGAGKDAWDASALAPLDEAFSEPFAEFQKVPHVLGDWRIAVLIDDLDRCSPANVVTMLETINVVMDVPGFVFVLALDYDVLVEAVRFRYPHVSGHEFIEKIIQLPFRVPPLDVSASEFLEELLPTWSTLVTALPDAVVRCAGDIAELGLRRNPRQIKRFFNSLLVIDRIMQARDAAVGYELLAAVIALQLGWPEEHRLLQEAVFLDSEEPMAVLTAKFGEDPALAAFGARFLSTETITIDELRHVLQLTAVVVAAPEQAQRQPLPGPADQVREEHRQQFIERLIEAGYEQSNRSASLYYHPRHQQLRFRFRKHNVNLERRQKDGEWSMEQQFLLTRELDRATEALYEATRRSTRSKNPARA
jgi:hypothetical protein